MPGLAFSLGAKTPAVPTLTAAAERGPDRRWRFVAGVGPVRAAQRFATDAPDGVRLLQIGKTGRDGLDPLLAATNAFYLTIHGLGAAATFRDWVILGDLPGGPRQLAYDWAPYAERFVLVVEPTWQSMLTARRIQRVATSARPEIEVSLVVNKTTGEYDAARVGAFLEMPVLAVVPLDEDVRAAELHGIALLDLAPNGPAVCAIEQLTDRLQERSLG